MINISKALGIQGWMTEPELTWLAEQAQEYKCIVEIGSFLGRSTRALADNTSGTVYAVDDWYGPRDVEISDEDRKKIFAEFQKNMDGLQGKLNVVRADHRNIVLDIRPDFVFIDGSHEYEDVKFDIEFWLKKAHPGALISGHDYWFTDVYRAVKEFLPESSCAPNTSIWYAVKPYPAERSSQKETK